MLIHGGPDLPERLPVLSPWVDADLGISASDVSAALAAQHGRRVVKTHTPADGIPIWQGITVIAVYRHPLDLFFSIRKHLANTADPDAGNPLGQPVAAAFRSYLNDRADLDNFDRDNLSILAMHYVQTVLFGRLRDLRVFHYADMVQDGRRAVQLLAEAAGIDADDRLIDKVAEATAFGAMRAKATDYAPAGGTGLWKSDANFFDAASSRKWVGNLTGKEVGLYLARLQELVPDLPARDWLERGSG